MPRKRYRRLFRLRFTRADSADVDDEFQFHLTMRARELEALGYAPERAREIALTQFGDIDDARQFCRTEDEERMRDYRRTLWLDNVKQDVVLAIRAMRRQPAFAFSTVLTLAVAIALAASAYGIVHAYLVRPLPYPDADRVVHVRPTPTRDPFPNMPSRQAFQKVDFGVGDSVFADVVMWDLDAFTLAGGDRAESVHGAWVSPGYFSTLGMRPAVGRSFEAGEFVAQSNVVIISDGLWSRRFNRDPSLIGKPIRLQSLDNPGLAEIATVVGVMPPNSWHVNRFTEVLRPLKPDSRTRGMARLKPGMSIEEAQRRLNALVLPQLGTVDPAYHLSLAREQDEYTYNLRPTLVALLGGALFLLLIAGASVAGAQTARAAARRAEVQVRMALGASRTRIAMQLLTESLVIAVMAGMIGGSIAALALHAFGGVVSAQLGTVIPGGDDRLALGVGMLAVVVGAGTLIGAAFGLLPALVVTGTLVRSGSLGASLGSQKGAARSAATPLLRRGLIIAQVAVTMMLLVGAGLMARTVLSIAMTPLGFDDTRVVKGDLFLPGARYKDAAAQTAGVDRLLVSIGQVPGVRAVASSFPDPLQTFTGPEVTVIGGTRRAQTDSGPSASQYLVTPAYFDVLGIPLRAGRLFGPQDDARSARVAVVSEGLARSMWPGETAIGRQVRAGGDSVWRTVVGVVGEMRRPVESTPLSELYVPYAQDPTPLLFIVARLAGSPGDVGTAMQRAVSRVDDALGMANVRPLSELTDRLTSRHRALATVLSLFAVLALGLAMLGLYASLAYVVAQRRREIAIRVAVGASAGAIRGLVAREGVALVATGLVLGIALSLALTRLLASQLYGVTPTDPVTFAGIAVVLGGSALLAALAPVRQAARVEPAEVMRSE
ncbi:MAG TPA: ADOP family duplicated permease [Gemmatimonadaceae bacterium]|nr:ADOP family duplicated permease [Gemmatimonadaceae bacterium]